MHFKKNRKSVNKEIHEA